MMRISGWHGARETHFTSRQSMAGQLPVSPAYVTAVKQSKPIGYWRFESERDGRFKSEVPSADLQIVGDVHLLGHGDNQLVEFGQTDSSGHLVSSKPLAGLGGKNYSVEVWVKPSHSHRGGLVGLVAKPHTEMPQPDPASAQGFSLELTGTYHSSALKTHGLTFRRSRIRFLHRDPPGGDYHTGKSCFSADPYIFRHWQHIVAVKQGARMRLYFDGRLCAVNQDPTSLARNLYLEIGKIIGTTKVLPFVGQLDELSIYNRALSDDEVLKHYRSIRWAPQDPQRPTTDVSLNSFVSPDV
jgi:hypothetical protein